MEQTFAQHVKEGLSLTPKKISSRYFYDAEGDRLFQKIMQLEEYYLPGCEMDIIFDKSRAIASDIVAQQKEWQIVELGAGDGSKTKYLLKEMAAVAKRLDYLALDISQHILDINLQQIQGYVPDIGVRNVAGNYFHTYPALPATGSGRLVLFLGANIGNFRMPAAIDFIRFVAAKLRPTDLLLVAFDLVKHPRKILAAYDDSSGVTRDFNLNLLTRMNRELGANFDLSSFDHFPFYDPITGMTSSQIISLKQQSVLFADGFELSLEAYEAIHTEISKKYFPRDIEQLATASGMNILETYHDRNKEYAFVLFQPNS